MTSMSERRGATARLAIAARPCLTVATADGARRDLLTARERELLAPIATLMRVERGAILFHEGTPATAIYDVADGVLKSFRQGADGRLPVLGFFFPQDIVGLAEGGNYVNTVQAITAAVLYRLPRPALDRLLLRDSELDHQFLIKSCDGLRTAQYHAVILGTGSADVRLARFLAMMRQMQPAASSLIELPMARGDIADYLGLTPETVSRAFTRLRRARILACPNPHLVRIIDEERFLAIGEQDVPARRPANLAAG